ncbi:hypothetical protein CK203_007043 [Vitis vinifera]|uniref:Uncharacterized protein n=1 Tax=Vitis vinifera TaxID=29760 RepID=A0A438KCM6_VITVI|nr:hypothetical protein CK203_007043 [Vitis vinifera]
MSWLLNSMQPKIAKPFLFLAMVKEIWDVVTHTYSKQGDAAQVFELMNRIHATKQGELIVKSYYNTLKCSLMHSEEFRIGVMMKTPSYGNSALNVAVENNPNTNKGREKDTRWCDYSKRPKHARETCWKMNGRPQEMEQEWKIFQRPTRVFKLR